MSSFEEDFPSLKEYASDKEGIDKKDEDYESRLLVMAAASHNGLCGTSPDYAAQEYVNTHHIEKFCLDKQRVKDAFGELTRIRGITVECQIHNAITIEKERILKTLGLEGYNVI